MGLTLRDVNEEHCGRREAGLTAEILPILLDSSWQRANVALLFVSLYWQLGVEAVYPPPISL